MADRLVEVLVFLLDRQRYALPQEDAIAILPAVTIVPLPKAPAIVEGVINVRGSLVPVLDLRSRFRLPAKEAEPTDHLILARAGTRLVAIRADRAVGLAQLQAGTVEDLTLIVPGAEYVAGVAKLPQGTVLIHDLRSFLSQAESLELAEALVVSSEAVP